MKLIPWFLLMASCVHAPKVLPSCEALLLEAHPELGQTQSIQPRGICTMFVAWKASGILHVVALSSCVNPKVELKGLKDFGLKETDTCELQNIPHVVFEGSKDIAEDI